MTGMSDTDFPPCPECGSEYTYEMDPLLVCPECGHEWDPQAAEEADASPEADDLRALAAGWPDETDWAMPDWPEIRALEAGPEVVPEAPPAPEAL